MAPKPSVDRPLSVERGGGVVGGEGTGVSEAQSDEDVFQGGSDWADFDLVRFGLQPMEERRFREFVGHERVDCVAKQGRIENAVERTQAS
jgi:hypothetical protein